MRADAFLLGFSVGMLSFLLALAACGPPQPDNNKCLRDGGECLVRAPCLGDCPDEPLEARP